MARKTCCEDCSNYEYDEYYDYYTCVVGLDQDDMERFLTGKFQDCPFYSYNAEYELAKKQ